MYDELASMVQDGVISPTSFETPTAGGLNSVAKPSGGGNWYDFFTHGGGSSKMTPQELQQISNISAGLKNETDPELIKALTQQKEDLMAGTQDRGGLLGALGRVTTGEGQTGWENAGTKIGAIAVPLIRAYLQQKAYQSMSNKVRNQYGQNAGMMQNQVNSILNR